MLIEITKFDPYVKNWQGLRTGVGVENGKTIFELTNEEYAHFIRNASYYKVKSKKLFFDETYKNKVEAKEESDLKAQKILNLRLELSQLKEQEEKFKKYNMVTEELETKILEQELKIKEAGGEPYINEEVEGKDEI